MITKRKVHLFYHNTKPDIITSTDNVTHICIINREDSKEGELPFWLEGDYKFCLTSDSLHGRYCNYDEGPAKYNKETNKIELVLEISGDNYHDREQIKLDLTLQTATYLMKSLIKQTREIEVKKEVKGDI